MALTVFFFYYFFLDGLCSPDGILLAPDGGTFRTPRYLEQYPPNLHCTWQIKAQENKKIVLKFR